MSENNGHPYADAPGAVPFRVDNIAPRKGELMIGYVPYGLTAIEGGNMLGKTRALSALEAMAVKKITPRNLTVTDGADHASVRLGTAELRITQRMLGGEAETKIERSGDTDSIETLPDLVATIITGGEHKEKAVDFRHRIKALNRMKRVEITEERLVRLVGPKIESPEAADLCSWLIEEAGRSNWPTMVEAAEGLAGMRGELNRRALEAEKAAEATRVSAERDGAVGDDLEERATAIVGEDADIASRLTEASAHGAESCKALAVEADKRLAEARARAAERARHQAQIEQIRAESGDLDELRAEHRDAATDLEAATREIDELAERLAALREARATKAARVEALAEKVSTLDRIESALSASDAPEAEDLALLEAAVEESSTLAQLAAIGERYVACREAERSHMEEHRRLTDAAAALREATIQTWWRLGEILTEAIDSSLLRCQDDRLEIYDDRGGTWRDIADDVRASRGLISRRVLDWYVEQAAPETTVLVDELLILRIDPSGREELSARCAEKRIRMLYEEPADCDPPVARWYGASA